MKILFFLIVFSGVFSCFGQEDYEELFITDTSTLQGRTIYIFSDKSWCYASAITDISGYIRENKTTSIISDTNQLFKVNWFTDKCHINECNLAGLVDSFEISIIPPTHSSFSAPLDATNLVITSTFKLRNGKWHKGIDFGVPEGKNVYSCWDGKVRYAQHNAGGYGNLIIIRHYNGLETYYAHLSSVKVKSGQYVKAGDVIGLSGNTGHSTGPHLHFEIRIFGNAFNPVEIFMDKFSSVVPAKFITAALFYYQKKSGTVESSTITGQDTQQSGPETTPDGKRRRNPHATYGSIGN